MGWGEARRDHATKPTEHHLRANGKSDTDCKSRNRHCKRNGHTSCTQSTHGAASAGRNWRGKNWMGGRARPRRQERAHGARTRSHFCAGTPCAEHANSAHAQPTRLHRARGQIFRGVARMRARVDTSAWNSKTRESVANAHASASTNACERVCCETSRPTVRGPSPRPKNMPKKQAGNHGRVFSSFHTSRLNALLGSYLPAAEPSGTKGIAMLTYGDSECVYSARVVTKRE